ncbi:hypothetical protein BDZ91DRAFT_799946 [Kalaharituber pfeilii]|nr:hypothetical protein BDZ91DRAFT_799946 [Kalaharituber pfeilii]
MASSARDIFQSILRLFEISLHQFESPNLKFPAPLLIDYERGRFFTWAGILGFIGVDEAVDVDSPKGLEDSQIQIREHLLNIESALHKALAASNVHNEPTGHAQSSTSYASSLTELYSCLQDANDALQALLSSQDAERMNTLWPRRNALQVIEALNRILGVETALSGIPDTQRQRIPKPTAVLGHLRQLVQQSSTMNKECYVENSIHVSSAFGEHSLGSFNRDADANDVSSLLLIEWKEYNSRWVSKIGHELYKRVRDLAKLLHHPEQDGTAIPDLRILRCIGWFHDEANYRFGFAYDLPGKPISLNSLIASKASNTRVVPPLGMRFELATALARCLRAVHDLGWLHKNISSYNIIFSPSDRAMTTTATPYLIGFHHSRIDDVEAFSEGPNVNKSQAEYQHPEYQASRARAASATETRFHRIYDYYSLGLVLLELARWQTLKEMLRGKDTFTPTEIRDYLLNKVGRIDGNVGATYRKVVVACLRGILANRGTV